jgi:hypothetical protein
MLREIVPSQCSLPLIRNLKMNRSSTKPGFIAGYLVLGEGLLRDSLILTNGIHGIHGIH